MPSPPARPRAFVIGHPIAQSRSPLLHGYWLQTLGLAGSYERQDVAPEKLAAFIVALRQDGWAGCNVTVPHKQAVMAFLDEVSPAARAIGAVNTIWRDGERLLGDNTDSFGFLANLDERAPGWDEASKQAVVLGAGGAARAVLFALLSRGFTIALTNRTFERAQELEIAFGSKVKAYDATQVPGLLSSCDVLVNTTALGMVGKPNLSVDLTPLKPSALVHDIVYVPLRTELLIQAEARGHRTVDGLGMLIHQAIPGFERWFGVRPLPDATLRARLEADIL